MIVPAVRYVRYLHAFESMLDVGRKNANRVNRQEVAGCPPPARGQQADGAKDLAGTRNQHDDLRRRNPTGNDQHKDRWECQMADSRHKVQTRQEVPQARPQSTIRQAC